MRRLLLVFCILAMAPFSRSEKNGDGFPGTLFSGFDTASRPTKFFFSPTSLVLNSLEISLSGGSSFGEEDNSGLLTRFGIGLGGVAEMEFSTTQVVNQLTGEQTKFPSRILKVNLLPERFSGSGFVPNIAVQLRTTSWGSVVRRDHALASEVARDFNKTFTGLNLQGLNLSSRFTTLYLVLGKEGELGGLHVGASLMDVRTKEGGQWVYDDINYSYDYYRIPEMQKNILKPFGGLLINANPSTQILAEVSAVPSFRYDIKKKTTEIGHAWSAIAGVRFFMLRWLSWDGGVRYLSTYDGIADAEISMALNAIMPFKHPNR